VGERLEPVVGSVWPVEVERMKAVVFDVDGTLYDQRRVRRLMVRRILASLWTRPLVLGRTVRAIAAYRDALEDLREQPAAGGDLAAEQLRRAADRSGLDAEVIAGCVERWMESEALDAVAAARRDGLLELLAAARARGMRLGVVSDYPAAAKLDALGVSDYFEVCVHAQDPDVQRLKPAPRGLELALERLDVAGAEAVYVGDRVDVDAEVARRAGLGCVIVGAAHAHASGEHWTGVAGFEEMHRELVG